MSHVQVLAVVIGGVLLASAFAGPSADALAESGARLFLQRQFKPAEAELRKALAIKPNHTEARLNLVRTLIEMDRVPEALQELQETLAIEPGNPEVEFQAGQILQDLASSRFALLRSTAPDSAEVHEMLGRQHELRSEFEKALAEYRIALKKDSNRAGIRYLIGNTLWKMRDNDAALAELRSELQRNPNHAQANYRVGNILMASGNMDEALPFLDAAVRANPGLVDARRELGKALRQAGRAQDARKELEAVAAARPNDDSVHALLAAVYRDLGDAAAARRELELHRTILQKKREAAEKSFNERRRE